MSAYCINLDNRPDRWALARKEFAKIGLSGVTRFSAIRGGWNGCRDSHLFCLSMGIKDRHVLIFEDDVLFLDPKTAVRDMQNAISELPEDFDMLCFGVSPQEPLTRHSEHLFRLDKKSFCTHAYMATNRNGMIDYILSCRNERGLGKLDLFYSEHIYPKFKCFLTDPLICTQRETGYSDTCTRSDVSTIEKNYKKFCI